MVPNLETPYRIFYITSQSLNTIGTLFFFGLTIGLTVSRNTNVTKYMRLVISLCFWGILYQVIRSASITATPFLDIHWIYQVLPLEISTILFRLEYCATAAERTMLTMTFVQRWILLKKPQWQYRFYVSIGVLVLLDMIFYNVLIIDNLKIVESCLFTCTNNNITAMLVVTTMKSDDGSGVSIRTILLAFGESLILFAVMLFCLISIWRHFRNLKSASRSVYRMEKKLCVLMIFQLLILVIPDLVLLPAIVVLSSIFDSYQINPLINYIICNVFIGLLNWYHFIWAYLIYWGHKGFYVKKESSKTTWFSRKSISYQKT